MRVGLKPASRSCCLVTNDRCELASSSIELSFGIMDGSVRVACDII